MVAMRVTEDDQSKLVISVLMDPPVDPVEVAV
jgi:hypothetical protein